MRILRRINREIDQTMDVFFEGVPPERRKSAADMVVGEVLIGVGVNDLMQRAPIYPWLRAVLGLAVIGSTCGVALKTALGERGSSR